MAWGWAQWDSGSESHSAFGENARGLEEEPFAPGPLCSLVKASFSEKLSIGPRAHQLFSVPHKLCQPGMGREVSQARELIGACEVTLD